jgi:hypothetical protein
MTPPAIEAASHYVRGRCMGCSPVTDDAVVGRGDPSAKMAPCAVPLFPISRVRPGRCLVMAAHTVILPMAAQAPLPVPCGLEAVTPHPPEICMITRGPGVVTLYTVVAVMTHITGRATLASFIPVEIDKGAVKPDPVSFMRIGRREGNASLFRDTLPHHILSPSLLHGFFRREGLSRYERTKEGKKYEGNNPSQSVLALKSHSAFPR